ncbi:MAG: ECF transporter S component [Lachnospiraceae bacterium]|nr:ECF transporter S component [Lachnospiraceae bacterium]
MDRKNKVFWITSTAIFIALLIILQAATAPLGNMFVTGSIVNLLLIISVMTCGLSSGLAVGVISPIMAKLFGIGPLWSLIPFIMLGNSVLILLWHLVDKLNKGNKFFPYILALVFAATAKFFTLYIGIVKIAIPLFLGLPEKQAAAISNMFSVPQLITAMIGGALAITILPTLKKAIGERRK